MSTISFSTFAKFYRENYHFNSVSFEANVIVKKKMDTGSLLTNSVSINIQLVDQNCFLTKQNIDIVTTLGLWVQFSFHFGHMGEEVLTLTATDYYIKSGQQGQSYTWTVCVYNWHPWHNEWLLQGIVRAMGVHFCLAHPLTVYVTKVSNL